MDELRLSFHFWYSGNDGLIADYLNRKCYHMARQFSIRRATAEDIDTLHDLLKQLEESLGAADRVQRTPSDLLRHGFSEFPLFQSLIAWQDDNPVGLALFFPEFSSWKGNPGVYVQDLYVAEATRGAGLGRQLMEAVFEVARQWGAAYCKLAVYDDNEPAIRFYRKLGFAESRDESVFLRDGL